MFTVKHITPHGESINEADSFTMSKKGSLTITGELKKDTVYFSVPDVGHCTIDSGDVYVMNSAGNTVAKYHLEGSPIQR